MNYIVIVVIILAVLISLIVAHRLSLREKRNRDLASRGNRILQRAEEIWETVEGTSSIINAPDIIEILVDYYLYQIRRREELSPQDDTAEYFAKAETFKGKISNLKVKNELKNDQEINQAKRVFSRASKALRAAHNKKLISGQACVSMRNALRRRLLDLEVDAYERLGDSAGERNDPAVATNYYKYAKKLLIESDLKFEGKNEKVRSITHKTQVLFGNAVADQLTKGLEDEENVVDEHGIPKDLDVMAGNKKKF